MNYIIYLRKSQKDNPEESVESVLRKHEIQLQEYAVQSLGYRIPENMIYREVVSGETIEARTEIKKVLELIESPDIKGVIVIEPQRLGRGDLQDCGIIVNAFRYSHTLIMTPSKNYDLTDKFDRKFFEMELQRGSDYLEYYKEIQARGRIASVKRGNYIGSIAPYGYNKIRIKDDDGRYAFTLEIVEKEAEAVRIIYDLYANKQYGFKKIANTLNELGYPPRNNKLWSAPAIKDILANPVYIGKIRWNHRKTVKSMNNGQIINRRPRNTNADEVIIVDGKHDAIVDKEVYERVQGMRSNNPRTTSYTTLRNHFSGLIFCEGCGKAMVLRPYFATGSKGSRERCSPRLVCNNQKYCNTGSAMYSQVNEEIVKILNAYLHDIRLSVKDNDDNGAEYHQNKINLLKKNIEFLEKKELSIWDKYTSEDMPENVFNELIKNNEHALNAARKSLEDATAKLSGCQTITERIASIENALTALQDDSVQPELKNSLLKSCIRRITYSRPRPQRIKKNDDNASNIITVHGWVESPITLDIELNF